MRNRIRTALIAVALGTLTLAAPSEAKKGPVAAFKLLSASGTQTHTFSEQTTDEGVDICTGTQSLNVRYHSTKPTKMYVFLREAHGLHTLVSDKPKPDSGLDYLSVPGEMTLSRSVSYEATQGCGSEPVECLESTFPNLVNVLGSHDPQGGIWPPYDTNVNLPSGLDLSCSPRPGPYLGPVSSYAVRPEQELEVIGAIPRSQIFNEKRKRLSGENSFEFPYETQTDPDDPEQTRVTGTYGESIAVELKRLNKRKK